MRLTSGFQYAYSEFENYPRHLVSQRPYSMSTTSNGKSLLEEVSHVLVENDQETDIKFRDLEYRGNLLEKVDILSDTDMKNHLGDKSLSSSTTTNQATLSGDPVTERDPRCRFVFLSSKDSRSRLRITKKSLARLLSYHQVMPHYLDLLLTFGNQHESPDPSISGFREVSCFERPDIELDMEDLGRSGKRYQLCYNLRAAAYKPDDEMWSVRAAAFYHQFDLKHGTTLWTVSSGASSGIYEQIKLATAAIGHPSDRDFTTPQSSLKASLSIHLLHARWALGDWRPYVQWIRDQVRERTLAAVEDRRDQTNRKEFGQDDLQRVQSIIEKLQEAIIVMEGNVKVLAQLGNYYSKLWKNKSFPLRSECSADIQMFARQIHDVVSDFGIELSKARTLATIANERKILILQFLQSQAAEKMEFVSIDTRGIAIKSRHEAVIVRIITIITLIFLPGTFVSKTFFSTDVIKYHGSGESNYSKLAMIRWAEVTVILTLLTGAIAGTLYFRSRRERIHEEQSLPRRIIKMEEV